MQNAQINDQRETTFLLAIHSAVKIDDSEEALPSTSGQPMSTGTSSEQSDSIRSPKVKNFFSLSGFPKRKKKYSSNRKPSKKLQEILQTMSSEEKKDLSQIYSELGGSESNLTTEMDAASDNQNGEMTTDDAMNTDVPKTSASSDNSERDKTPERLPDINVHGIPSRYSSEKKHFTEEQTVSSQDEKMPDKVSKSFSKRKRNLNNVISILHSTLSSDSDAPDRSAKDLQTQATSESHPSGRSSMTEPESILRSPLTLEKDGSKAEVSTSISDASVETMENDLSTSLLSNGESFPVTSPSNVTTLLKEKAQNKRRISNIASPQQIMAISRKLGTLTGQFRSIVPQIQSTINCPRRNTAKNAEQNADGHAPSKIPPKPKTSARPREATELKRLRSSAGWIVKRGHSRRQLSVKTLPAENNPHEPLRNWKTSDDSIRIKDLDKKESITSKRPRLQDHDELLPSRLPQRTEVKPPKQQDNPENQDDDNVTEDSLVEETETLRSEEYDQPSGHHSGPSEMITPVRRRLISLFPCRVSQSSFQHEGVEDLHDMDGFGSAVAGQCRRMPEDRQAKYMSYVLASADLFRGYAKLPDLEVLITNLRTGLARFQQSSSCGAIGSSD
ncbi:uncharacterized protein [Phyllobates terribilis]|uniref:uncharacterized protein isoform X2 n=1 Tax=Phyllobates terribilis TaxID=111132 RepID=UPI003CCB07F1